MTLSPRPVGQRRIVDGDFVEVLWLERNSRGTRTASAAVGRSAMAVSIETEPWMMYGDVSDCRLESGTPLCSMW